MKFLCIFNLWNMDMYIQFYERRNDGNDYRVKKFAIRRNIRILRQMKYVYNIIKIE